MSDRLTMAGGGRKMIAFFSSFFLSFSFLIEARLAGTESSFEGRPLL